MPAPIDIFWLIPLIPFLGSLFIGFLLIIFNRTMNRLSKPVAFIQISSVFISALISYLLLAQELSYEKTNEILVDWNQVLGSYDINIKFLIDKITSIELAIISSLSIILMFIFHFNRYRKKQYVLYFVYLGLTISSILFLPINEFFQTNINRLLI